MKKTNNQELVANLEWLRQTVESAMEEQFKPVYKNNGNSISEEQDYIYESDLNQYEKAVLLYMNHVGPDHPLTMADIAKATSVNIASVKRVIKTAMERETIMRAPYSPGYILTKFA